MELYGRASEERLPSCPSLEWTSPGSETGIEASMWRLGLQGGGSESYPERPNEPDCIYFLRTGVCGYGSRCRFNHPRNPAPVLEGLRTEAGEFPDRTGQPVCQHFMQTGTCKFGASCKYHHPREGRRDFVTPISLNHMGFPLRSGEKECCYYMRTGQCKFGSTCRFHHPVPPGVQAPSQQQQQQQLSAARVICSSLQSQSVPSSQQYGVVIARPQLLPGSYVQSPYGYTQMVLPSGMVPYSGWNPYQASGNEIPSPGTQQSVGSSSVYGITPLSPSAPAYQSGLYPAGTSNKEFPQRLGQPECQYFMRTGDCKFGFSCRYHHPLEVASPKAITLSHIGLPPSPGAAQCTHFAQHGICKFGPACKFDHSMGSSSLNYIPSASSLTEVPVAPYPLGSSPLGTLAPSSSSSSSDQRTKLLSSSPIKSKTTTNGGSETLAAGVSSSSSATSGVTVSHPNPAETNKGDSTSIETKTSS